MKEEERNQEVTQPRRNSKPLSENLKSLWMNNAAPIFSSFHLDHPLPASLCSQHSHWMVWLIFLALEKNPHSLFSQLEASKNRRVWTLGFFLSRRHGSSKGTRTSSFLKSSSIGTTHNSWISHMDFNFNYFMPQSQSRRSTWRHAKRKGALDQRQKLGAVGGRMPFFGED